MLSITVFAQKKDRRAELETVGRIKEISVAPNENIWLATAMGNTYYTNGIDSSWHYGEHLKEFEGDSPNLDRISFFNKDTAIISGYIREYAPRTNGYYLTKDAGKTWELKDYGGGSWIYTIHVDKNGNAWMGGASKELYFSQDFGESWRTIKLPYKSSDRTYGIHMIDNKNGIASSDRNEILITKDNWNTIERLKTPLQQKKYEPERKDYPDSRMSKIYIWGDYIVVNQKDNIFYTKASEIDWKKFPIELVDFEIHSNELYAVTNKLKIVVFTSPKKYEYLSDNALNAYPIDIKIVNHSLFAIDRYNEIYKVNKDEFVYAIPYTIDKEIEEPRIVKQYDKLTWGINGNQIYLSEDNGKDWYRENVIEYSISDFQLKNDSLAILWDGHKNNYTYSLKTHTAELYFPAKPLEDFLEYPLKSLSINSGSQGCFHSVGDEIEYKAKDASTLSISKVSGDIAEKSTFKNEVSSLLLTKILDDINKSPSRIPSIKDFNISEEDKKNYLSLVDRRLKAKSRSYNDEKITDKDFYYSVPKMLETLDSEIIAIILNQREGIWSTTTNWFGIKLVNENKDILKISRTYASSSLPWHLPWKFEINGQYFNCYNIDFSRFTDNSIPEDFMSKEVFDNKYLIMEIADYLHTKREEQSKK